MTATPYMPHQSAAEPCKGGIMPNHANLDPDPHNLSRIIHTTHVALTARHPGDPHTPFAEPVILSLTPELRESLRHKTRAFARAQDPETYAHEYVLEHVPLRLPINASDTTLKWPDAPTSLDVLEHKQSVRVLKQPLDCYLAVSESGVSFLRNGDDEIHGPKGTYETQTLTLEQLGRF